jgi:hypothetical protein
MILPGDDATDNKERQNCSPEDMADAFERAQDLGAMFTEGSTAFVEVFVTRAAQLHRLMTDDGDPSESHSPKWPVLTRTDDFTPILNTASRGFALVERLNKAGDPSLKLEKYLLNWVGTYTRLR